MGDFRAHPAAFRPEPADGTPGEERSLTEWLETSYRALPSEQHRHMFLDAATLMHRRPLAHLHVTWVALVHLDSAAAAAITDDAAEFAVDRLLTELLDSSLIAMTHVPDDIQRGRCAAC